MGSAAAEGLIAAAPGIQQYGEGIGAAQERAQRASEATRAHDLSATLGQGQLAIRERLAKIEEGMGPARIAKMKAESEEAKARAKVAVESLPHDLAASAAAAGLQTENLAFLVAARPLRLQMLQADLTGKETANEFAEKMADPKYDLLLQEIKKGGVTLEQLKLLGPARLKQLGAETSRIEGQIDRDKQKLAFEKKLEPHVLEEQKIRTQLAKLEQVAKEHDISPGVLAMSKQALEADLAMTTEQTKLIREQISGLAQQREQQDQAPMEHMFSTLREAFHAAAKDDQQARDWDAAYLVIPALSAELENADKREEMIADLARAYMTPVLDDFNEVVEGTGMSVEDATKQASAQIDEFTRESSNLVKFMVEHFAEKGDAGPILTATMIYHQKISEAMEAKLAGDLPKALSILQEGFKEANKQAQTMSPRQSLKRFLKGRYSVGAGLVKELDSLIDATKSIAEEDKAGFQPDYTAWMTRWNEALRGGRISEGLYEREVKRAEGHFAPRRQPLFMKPSR